MKRRESKLRDSNAPDLDSSRPARPLTDHRPYDHSGGAPANPGSINDDAIDDASDDPEDHRDIDPVSEEPK